MTISSNEEDDLYRAREAAIRLGRQIAERRVEGRSSDGQVIATALVTGQIIGIDINPRVFRNPDSQGLSASVLEAVNRATTAAAEAHLEGLAEATGLPISSYGEILATAQKLSEDLFDEAQEMRQRLR